MPPENGSDPQRVVVLACKVFESLLNELLPPGLAEQFIYLDYGLHRVPKKLKWTVQDEIDAIETPSVVMLGYGLCGNGLHEVKAGPHTLLIPRADDCIAILLGSYRAYLEAFQNQPGTYYLTKGWLESGSDPLKEYRQYVEKYGEAEADWLMDQQYQHYRQLVMVAHSQEDLQKYRPKAMEVAEFCRERWGWEYQEVLGSDVFIRGLISLAQNSNEQQEDFLVIPPGGELRQDQFRRS